MADLISAPYAPTQLVFRYSFARFIVPIEWYDGANPFQIPENWDIRFAKLTGINETPLQEIWNDPDHLSRPQSHALLVDYPTPTAASVPGSNVVIMFRNDAAGIFPLLFLDIKTAASTTSNFAPGAAVAETIRFNWNGGNPFVETAIGASAAEQRLVALESQVVALQSGGVMAVGSLAETQAEAALATGIRFYGDTTNGKVYIYLNGVNRLLELVTKQKPLS
ncbi:hypothetical protein [Larkinella humicola]|uniref:Uncharacterized protein n=1 Tax=Larkinella humicola TaxID=2607654 RepID=A0A5N1JTW6_9BACT|nr:hypothetical protein [Larkinella humicola]KAA9357243.1 hypothetical protein F0P93_05765 [Larkinella humicola]